MTYELRITDLTDLAENRKSVESVESEKSVINKKTKIPNQ